jgi:hypothetical protein
MRHANGMRRMRKLLILPIGLLALAIFGFVVMTLWNWLLPALLGVKAVTFWQALGLLALSRILFGGFWRGGRWGRPKFVTNWNQLTPEEQEKFRAGMRRKCGPGPGRDPEVAQS